MSRASNDGATRHAPSATEVMDTERLLGGGLVQGKSGAGKTALMAEVALSVLAPQRECSESESPHSESPARKGFENGGGLISKLIRALTGGSEAGHRTSGEPGPAQPGVGKPESAKVGALITGADGELVRAVALGLSPERREDLQVVDIEVLTSAELLTPPSGWSAEDFAMMLAETLFDCMEFATYARRFVMDSVLALVIANQELVRRGRLPRYSLMDLSMERFYERCSGDGCAEECGEEYPQTELFANEAERAEYLSDLLSEVPDVRREVLELLAVTLDEGPNQVLDDRRRLLRYWLGYTGSDRTQRTQARDVSKRAAELSGAERREWATEVERRAANAAGRTVSTGPTDIVANDDEPRRIPRISPAALPQALSESRIVLVEGMRGPAGVEDPASKANTVRYSWDCYTALAKTMLALASGELSGRLERACREGRPEDLATTPVMVFADRLESDSREDGAVLQIPRFLSVLDQCGSGHTGVWAATRSMEPLGLTVSGALFRNLPVRAMFGGSVGGGEQMAASAALLGVSEPELRCSRMRTAAEAQSSTSCAEDQEDKVRDLAGYLCGMPRREYLLGDLRAELRGDWCEVDIPGSPAGTRRARTLPMMQ